MREIDLSLYLVTDQKLCLGRDLTDIVEESVRGGVTLVQLREKDIVDREFYRIALKLKNMLKKYHVPLIINNRVDIAIAVGADGVHLGQNDIHHTKARLLLDRDALIGLSIESLSQVKLANNTDVDYLSVSPIFYTPTKVDTVIEWGLEGLKQVREMTNKQLVSIGGINQNNIMDIMNAGSQGVAVVSAICSADNPFKTTVCLKKMIDEYKKD